jgi:hypothetical protein
MVAYMLVERYHNLPFAKMKSTHIDAAVLLVKKGEKKEKK